MNRQHLRILKQNILAETVVAMIFATWVVHVKNEQARMTITGNIRNGNSRTLVLRAEPSRNRPNLAPTTCNITACIQISADAIVAVILTTRIVDVKNN